MNRTHDDLLAFLADNYRRGGVVLIGAKDPVGLAIRECQRPLTPHKDRPSLWSHVFLFGELRPTRRGLGQSVVRAPYIFESDLHFSFWTQQLRNGAQENWVGKWCGDEVEHAAVLDFGLTADEADRVLGMALQLCDEEVQYPLGELVGTWFAMVTGRVWAPNPLDDPHAMYCSAFVRYCFASAGKDFLPPAVASSNTAPEHIFIKAKVVAQWDEAKDRPRH